MARSQGRERAHSRFPNTHITSSLSTSVTNTQVSLLQMDGPAYRDTIDQVREAVGVDLKVGVGRARTAQAAGMTAKHELERCRAEETRVELGWE